MQILETFRFWNAHPDIIWRRNYVYGVPVKITLYDAFSKLYWLHSRYWLVLFCWSSVKTRLLIDKYPKCYNKYIIQNKNEYYDE